MKIKEYSQMMHYLTRPKSMAQEPRTTENPTLVKNMKHVKWNAIPPLKGPDPKGLLKDKKQDKPIQENKYGRYR